MTPRGWIGRLAAGAVIAAAVAFGAFAGAATSGGGGQGAAALTPAPVARVEVAAPGALVNGSLADLVDEVRRSVVAIGTAQYGDGERMEGLGSGVIVDRAGHILTNYHVIEGAEEITVKLWDGTTGPARVVGYDLANDLAVVRAEIDAGLLVPARFGDSDLVRPGDPVFAIGSPFAFEFTVTAGIVSGVRDDIPGDDGRPTRAIQTDAAVNPGNSGGPLYTQSGEVIGINTSIIDPSGRGVFVGIGLAVPSNTALRFLPAMIEGGRVRHPALGIRGLTVTAELARDAGLDVAAGVLVGAVAEDGAADRAGIRAASAPERAGGPPVGGDVIVAFDGAAVASIGELARLVDLSEVGDVVTLGVLRDGERIDVTVMLRPRVA